MKVSDLVLPGCCSAPCVLKRGTNASITLSFSTDKNYTAMNQSICGEFGACIKLPSLPADFCKYATCPMTAGTAYKATVGLPVLTTYPKV